MKVAGKGQGKILTAAELRLLFSFGLLKPRDRALFGICLFTGCRVSEALALQTTDIKNGTLAFRKYTTKGKLKTYVVDIQPGLAQLLALYQPALPGFLFPGRQEISHSLTRFMADKILKSACLRVGLSGVSAHSFKRTALTIMFSTGKPLQVIQEISSYNDTRDIAVLAESLTRAKEQKCNAVYTI